MKKTILLTFLSLLGLFVFIPPLSSDIRPAWAPPITATSITMTEEIVTVNLGSRIAQVKAVFILKNTAMGATEIEVGFPVERSSQKLQAFSVIVDGEKVELMPLSNPRLYSNGLENWDFWENWEEQMRIRMEKAQTEDEKEEYRNIIGNYLLRDYYRFFNMWKMTFASYQSRKVEVSYWFRHYGDFKYILLTGAFWKGPIGKAKIEIKFDESFVEKIQDVSPPGFSSTNRSISWNFRDFEPTQNIRIKFREGTTAAKELSFRSSYTIS